MKTKTTPWSPTGTYYNRASADDPTNISGYPVLQIYEHIEVVKNDELITSCNACGREAYERFTHRNGQVDWRPSGVTLMDMRFCSNGYQTTIVRICVECARDLRTKLAAAVKGDK